MTRAILRNSQPPSTNQHRVERLRLQLAKQSIIALCAYILVWGMAFASIKLGVTELAWPRFLSYVAVSFSIQIGFVLCFYKGLNLHFKDKSLATLQMCVSFSWCIISVIELPQIKGIIALISIGFFMLSVFQYPQKSFYILPILAIAGLAIGNYAHALRFPSTYDLAYSAIEFFVYSAIIIWLTMIATYSQKVRYALKVKKRQLQRANRNLGKLSIKDGLTGLKNHRYFESALEQEWARATRGNTLLALLVIDLDHFKHVNDTFGHEAGDACLRHIAKLIQSHAQRAVDVAARYGGEEFVLLLPGINGNKAEALALSFIDAIEQQPAIYRDQKITLSASIGVAAMYPIQGLESSLLFRTADKALYEAKKQGRHRVIVNALD